MTIEVRTVDSWAKPIPAGDPVSTAFWEAAAQGRLLIQHCLSCGSRQFYPRAICTTCGTDPEWEEASGRGTVHTFTIIRQQGAEPFKGEVPYVVAMIALDEGPMMMGNVTGCLPDDVSIGMVVRAYSVEVEPGVGVVYWEPAEESP
jgi:uncharacterized OB-fold protein